VNASKIRFDRAAAIALARGMKKIRSGRGKKVVVVDLETETIDDDALAAILLGPTGNLKAPTLKVGTTLLVGFSEINYREVFGV